MYTWYHFQVAVYKSVLLQLSGRPAAVLLHPCPPPCQCTSFHEWRRAAVREPGVLDSFKGFYSLRRLDLAKVRSTCFTGRQKKQPHAKVVPTLTLSQAMAPDRTRSCNTDLAAAEAAVHKIKSLPPPVLVTRPPASYLPGTRTINLNKVFVSNRANRVFRFDTDDACVLTMPSLHEHKYMPLAISVPPTTSHVYDDQDSGDLYIIDRLLKLNKGMAQFEALVWPARSC